MTYILAMDQGTTSSRSIVFDHEGEIVSLAQAEIRQIYPQPGWVEHDPHELFQSQIATARAALDRAGLNKSEIQAVGITNQRETTIIWDKLSGDPIYNAVVWQDRRTASLCDKLRTSYALLAREKTGLEIDAYFSASKLAWLLENIPGARERAQNGELAFGTVDSWLIWKLTHGKAHVTDVSNASRTLLFNIHTLQWDAELLDIFGIPYACLPVIASSSDRFGQIETAGLRDLPITGVAGDQQAALFGQACFDTGETKCTYGTGCFMLQNTGGKPVPSNNRMLTTVGWKIGDTLDYALEGSVFIGGAVIQWLRDALGVISTTDEVEKLTGSIPDNGGVYFVPAFAGLGTPHWDQDARGTIVGLTRGTGKEHIARAAVESVAFQTADLIAAMNADSATSATELKVDGGATRNSFLLQFQADILQLPVVRSKITETTALGAAYLAGLSCGFWKSKDDLRAHWKADRVFEPEMPPHYATELIGRWHDAVNRSLGWERQ